MEKWWVNGNKLMLYGGDHKNFGGKPKSDLAREAKPKLILSRQGNHLPERRDFYMAEVVHGGPSRNRIDRRCSCSCFNALSVPSFAGCGVVQTVVSGVVVVFMVGR
jgi:hypothetical protein